MTLYDECQFYDLHARCTGIELIGDLHIYFTKQLIMHSGVTAKFRVEHLLKSTDE